MSPRRDFRIYSNASDIDIYVKRYERDIGCIHISTILYGIESTEGLYIVERVRRIVLPT